MALPAAVSRAFSENIPGAGRTPPRGDPPLRRRPRRASARSRAPRRASGSGSTPTGPYLLFPHETSRPLKRFDRAREAAGDVPLLTLGGVPAEEVPYWINAANAVIVPSQDEGMGLAVIEASACDVPAFGTPVGAHAVALAGIEGSALPGLGPRSAGARRSRRTSRRPTRGSTAAPPPSASPPTAWPRGWSRRGGRCCEEAA